MKIKVHWIIDGVAEIEADTPEEAENKVENELSKFMGWKCKVNLKMRETELLWKKLMPSD